MTELTSTAPPRSLPGMQNSAANLAFNAAGTRAGQRRLRGQFAAGAGCTARAACCARSNPGRPTALSLSADGRTLATFGRDQSVSLWDITSGRLLRKLAADSRVIHDLALSPDGRTLITAGGERNIKVWDAGSGQLRRTIDAEALSLAFSPDGRMLAFSGTDRGVSVVNLPAGAPERLAGAHDDTVRRLAFSPDGRLIASAGADDTVRIWNVASAQLQRTLRGHSNAVYGVAFSPDGKLLATASWDASVRLWQVADGALVAALLVVDRNDWLVMTPEGLFDGSPGAWSRIQLRFSAALRDVAPLDLFFADFFHPGLLTS